MITSFPEAKNLSWLEGKSLSTICQASFTPSESERMQSELYSLMFADGNTLFSRTLPYTQRTKTLRITKVKIIKIPWLFVCTLWICTSTGRVHSISQWWGQCINGDGRISWSIRSIASLLCAQRGTYVLRTEFLKVPLKMQWTSVRYNNVDVIFAFAQCEGGSNQFLQWWC